MPAVENRIIYSHIDVEGWNASIEKYISDGGYETLSQSVKRPREELCAEVEKSKLKGRGGAGFPTGMKWKFLDRKSGKPIYLVCNADESEPGTCKDRLIIYQDPHKLIEGIMCACYAINAAQAFIYIRGEYANGYRILQKAIAEARARGFAGENICGSGYSCDIAVSRGAGCYVAERRRGDFLARGRKGLSEDQAAVLSRRHGTLRLPDGGPTMWKLSAGFPKFSGAAARQSPKSAAVRPRHARVGRQRPRPKARQIRNRDGRVHSRGAALRPLRRAAARQEVQGGHPGGSSMKILRWDEKFRIKNPDGTVFERRVEDIPLDSASFMQCGTAIGSCGVIVMDNTIDMVEALANLNQFYAHESCRPVAPRCREGTLWMSRITRRICEGWGRMEDIDLLKSVADNICGRTICALGEGAAWPAQSNVSKFRDEYCEKIRRQQAVGGQARLDNNAYRLI